MIINKELYTRICNICDFILTDIDTNTRRICISWLHVIRPHPIILNLYQNILKNDFNDNNKTFFNYILLRKSLYLINEAILSIFKSKKNLYSSNLIHNKDSIDYLFVSHLLNPNDFNKTKDFYFENTQVYLNNQGLETVTIFFNHTNKKNSYYKSFKKQDTKKIILADKVSFFLEFYILINLFIESFLLFKKSNLYKHDKLFKNILFESSKESLTNHTIDNLRKYYQFKFLIKKLKPKKIITTYEGHAWERLMFYAAKECNPNIKCCGYQHTSLFNLQHAALRKLNNFYNPDLILTPGIFSYNIFINSDVGRNIPILILGSNRGTEKGSYMNQFNNTCIVIPEAFESECLILFRFVVKCSNFSKKINFLLKLHPMMNRETFLKKYPEFNVLPINVKWSNNDISADFSISKWVLYRGTTMVVQAFQNNLIPIYYQHAEDEISLDILEDVSDCKSSVKNVQEFFQAIQIELENNNRDIIYKYCSNLYQNFNYNILHQISI